MQVPDLSGEGQLFGSEQEACVSFDLKLVSTAPFDSRFLARNPKNDVFFNRLDRTVSPVGTALEGAS